MGTNSTIAGTQNREIGVRRATQLLMQFMT